MGNYTIQNDTTPVINILNDTPASDRRDILDSYLSETMTMHRAARPPVQWHKEKLGRQKYCWPSGEYRFWICEGPGWCVYCSNQKGVCFEVQSDLDWRQALDAWKDYQKKVGLIQ